MYQVSEQMQSKFKSFLTIDQVQRLRTNFEIDDGVPRYDVEFFTDNLKYEFEIDAQTGKILSFDRDDRRD